MNNRDRIIVGLLAFVINKNITIKAIPEQNYVFLVFKVDVCSGKHVRIQTAEGQKMAMFKKTLLSGDYKYTQHGRV